MSIVRHGNSISDASAETHLKCRGMKISARIDEWLVESVFNNDTHVRTKWELNVI